MNAPAAVVVLPEQGEWISFHGIPSQILLGGSRSAGGICINLGIAKAGSAAPPHLHDFAEAFYLIEGAMTFRVGDSEIEAAVGDLIHLPAGVPHQPINQHATDATLLTICLPAGFDYFQREIGVRVAGPEGPFPCEEENDWKRMRESAAKHGIQFDLPSNAFEQAADHLVVKHTTGKLIAAVGDLYRFLVSGEQSGGAYAIWHATVPPGGGPPPHRHSREQEIFFVLKGEVVFFDDGKPVVVGAGGLVFLPQGNRHWFSNQAKEVAEMLIMVAPAGLEGLFEKTGKPWPNVGILPPQPGDEDKQRLAEQASEYGITLG